MNLFKRARSPGRRPALHAHTLRQSLLASAALGSLMAAEITEILSLEADTTEPVIVSVQYQTDVADHIPTVTLKRPDGTVVVADDVTIATDSGIGVNPNEDQDADYLGSVAWFLDAGEVTTGNWTITYSDTDLESHGVVAYQLLVQPTLSASAPSSTTSKAVGDTLTASFSAGDLSGLPGSVRMMLVPKRTGDTDDDFLARGGIEIASTTNLSGGSISGTLPMLVKGDYRVLLELTAYREMHANEAGDADYSSGGTDYKARIPVRALASGTVQISNSAPVWTSIPNQTIPLDGTLHLDVSSYLSDANQSADTVQVSVQSFSNDTYYNTRDFYLPQVLSLIPKPDTDGTSTVKLRATDNEGATSDVTFTVTIDDSNASPVVNDMSRTSVEGEPVAIDLEAWDRDGDSLDYAIITQPEHGELRWLDADTVEYVPEDNGLDDYFSFVASDGTVTSVEGRVSLKVQVDHDNPAVAPQVRITDPAVSATKSPDSDITIKATIAETADPIKQVDHDEDAATAAVPEVWLHADAEPVVRLSQQSNGTWQGKWEDVPAGTYRLHVAATDTRDRVGMSAVQTLYVSSSTEDPDGPLAASLYIPEASTRLPDKTVPVAVTVTGEDAASASISWQAWDWPAGGSISFSDDDNTNTNVTFNGNTPGLYTIACEVDDGTDTVVGQAVIEVLPANSNTAPVADAGSDRTATKNTTVKLDGTGSSDADGDKLRYSWRMLEYPGANTPSLRGAATAFPRFRAESEGTYVVGLRVYDGSAWSSEDEQTVTAVAGSPITVGTPVLVTSGIVDLTAVGTYDWIHLAPYGGRGTRVVHHKADPQTISIANVGWAAWPGYWNGGYNPTVKWTDGTPEASNSATDNTLRFANGNSLSFEVPLLPSGHHMLLFLGVFEDGHGRLTISSSDGSFADEVVDLEQEGSRHASYYRVQVSSQGASDAHLEVTYQHISGHSIVFGEATVSASLPRMTVTRLDLGTATSAVMDGYERVKPEGYTSTNGHGWEDASAITGVWNDGPAGVPNDLNKDSHRSSEPGVFLYDLPSGTYRFEIGLGGKNGSNGSAAMDDMDVFINGKKVLDNVDGTIADWYEVTAAVTDDRLRLRIVDDGGVDDVWGIWGLQIDPQVGE